MFFARWDRAVPGTAAASRATSRWLRRVWGLFTEEAEGGEATQETIDRLRRKLHQTLKQVTREMGELQFNTVVAALMELQNELSQARSQGGMGTPAWREAQEIYLKMLAPVAPHIADELWERMGKGGSIHLQPWPEVDEKAAAAEEITLVVQVNGKLRDRITVPVGIEDDEARRIALDSEGASRFLEGKEVRQVIVVPGRLVNIVAR